MNKLVAILALGVCFSNVYAKGPKKNKAEEEGFVFTTVKENPVKHLLVVLNTGIPRSRTVACRKGRIRFV